MKYVFLLISLLFSVLCNSQIITVFDEDENVPMEFVSITGTESNITIVTNKKGKANISQLKTEKTISVQFLGYETLTFSYEELVARTKPILMPKASFLLNPIVISANRWEQEKNDVPHKISSISKKSIAFQNPQTSADLLAANGDVFIQKSQQGGGSPIIRGFATNRLLYSVDGVRMNTAIFRSGNLQNVISLDPFAMQKVEVLFGPGSILYGSDAIGGVMNFTTKQALTGIDTVFVSGNAALRFSSANSELTNHADIALNSERWGLISSFTHTTFGDLRMGTNGPSEYNRDSLVVRTNGVDLVAATEDKYLQLPTAYSQNNFMQKVVFRPDSIWKLQYALHYSETSSFDRYDRLIEKRDNQFRYAEWYYGPQIWVMNQIGVEYKKPSSFFEKMKVTAAVQRFEESRIDRRFREEVRRTRKEDVDAYSINFDFVKSIGNQHQLYYGVEGVLNTVESNGSAENITTNELFGVQSRYPESNWYSTAIYLNDQYNISEKTVIESGVRLNYYGLKSSFDTSFIQLPFSEISFNKLAINGSLGLVHKAKENLIFSANASSGFRSPNVDDIGKFFDSEPNSVVIPNSELEAEFAYNFDVGFAYVFKNKIKVDASFYYTLLNNALVRRDFQLNGDDSLFFDGENKKIQAIQNAANAYVYGLQLGVEAKLSSHFSFSSQINYQKGEEELDDKSTTASRHVAPLFGISRINYLNKKWKLQLNLQFSDELSFNNLNSGEQAKPHLYAQDESGNPFSPSWYTFNFLTQYQINQNFSTTVALENISDQKYRTYSSGIAAAGRNLVISLQVKF